MRRGVLDALGMLATMYPVDKISNADLIKKLQARRPRPFAAHFVLRRRLSARNGSVIVQGDLANLDVNSFSCPKARGIVGCRGTPYDGQYLGAFVPSDEREPEWSETIPGTPAFKYCRATRPGKAEQPSRRIPGVAILMADAHANLNVGHQAKDLVFLAHMLVEEEAARGTADAFTISTVLVDDLSTATGNLSARQALKYRKSALDALLAGHTPPVHVGFLQQNAHRFANDFGRDAPWQGTKSVCFDVMLQKGFAYPGDWRGAQLFRERVYASCDIPRDGVADTALVIVHGTASNGANTRQWANQDGLIASIKARPFMTRWCAAGNNCPPMRMVVQGMAVQCGAVE